MFHLAAFTGSQAVVATPTALPAIQDGYFALQSLQYVIPKALRIYGAYAQGANIGRADINTPSLRQVGLPSIVPVAASASILSLFPVMTTLRAGPTIPIGDQIVIETTNGGGAAEQQTGGLWMGDGNFGLPSGDIITVRATASITAGNLAWGAGTFTFDTGLPNGRYAVIGMDVIGANLLFARLVFPDNGPKPGVLARASTAILPSGQFMDGKMGVFGEFFQNAPPSIELFGSAAPTTQQIFLQLVRR